jgi:hypothetical protein
VVTPVTALGDPILTREDVARWLQLKPRQVERLGIPYMRLGKRTIRYRRSEVEAWLATCRQAA